MSLMQEFWQSVTRDGTAKCWLCRLDPVGCGVCRARSAGRMDAHHVIPQHRLKAAFRRGGYVTLGATVEPLPRDVPRPEGALFVPLEELLMDPRNGVALGRWHHDQLEMRRAVVGRDQRRVARSDLPVEVEDFAALLGLGWSLESDYGRFGVAA